MVHENLKEAKEAKNDEFYTQYEDIEREMNAYLEYDQDVFLNKTILLPCDDPEWSNFTKYFAQNFQRFGLKKLISTSYAPNSNKFRTGYQPTLFEVNDPQYDEYKTKANGKIFILDKDNTGDGRIDVDDLEWHYLQGDGDFRSKEVLKLRDEADIIITNPPFSLFRDFLSWTIENDKSFAIIGNKNAITYKEVFPLIQKNKIWIGKQSMGYDMLFNVPDEFKEELQKQKKGSKYRIIDNEIKARSSSCWFTNIEHGRRHQPLSLMSMNDNLKYSKHKTIKENGYLKYDNYDAIEVPYTDAIPSDYNGIMGVPISFLDKYCPTQFKILGMSASAGYNKDIVGIPFLGEKDARPNLNGNVVYARIFIQKI